MPYIPPEVVAQTREMDFDLPQKLRTGIDWRKDHLLSLAGVYQPKEKIEESAVPLALTQYLHDHPEIKVIVLRLDNDRVGRLAASVHTLGSFLIFKIYL